MEGVECVVNYEIPHQFKTYLHRVGRTARAGERGVAYTLLAPEEVIYMQHMMDDGCVWVLMHLAGLCQWQCHTVFSACCVAYLLLA